MAQISVKSSDGTLLNLERTGDGIPLVVVPGALFPVARWQRVLPTLSRTRCVLLLERRGRGKSGNAPSYQPEREVEDLLSVLATLGAPVDLLGHSSGAILALQAAARLPRELRRLVLYEPPLFFRAEDQIARDLPERLEALCAAGDPGGAIQTFLREGPRASEAEIALVSAGPAWPELVRGFGATVAYDAHVQRSFVLDRECLAKVGAPTLMLVGSKSPERMRHGSEIIAGALPNARIELLDGQEHVALVTAPALFAEAVHRHLDAS